MKTPYQLLDISSDASDTKIKQAYLQKVKDNPPDRNQALFQSIHDAYLLIKDNKSRLKYALFSVPLADFDGLINEALHTEQVLSINSRQFNALLMGSLDDRTILNAISSSKEE